MAWQDRDYAKFTDDEFTAVYGVRGAAVPAPAGGPGRMSTRRIVWTLVAMAFTGASVFGWHERGLPGSVPGAPTRVPTPAVMYGTLATSGPFAGDVCTEDEYVPAERAWRCDVYAVNPAHVPVVPATPYRGQCAHLRVDGHDWVCLSAIPDSGTSF